MNPGASAGLRDHFHKDELPSRRELLRILFRQKRKFIGFFVMAVVATAIATLLTTPKYESEAKLLIKVGRENVSMDPSVLGPTMQLLQDRANEINSEIEILTSTYLVEQVIREIGVSEYLNIDDPEPDELSAAYEAAVLRFTDRLSASSSSDDNIITLTFQARTPELAQSSLAMLIGLYLDRHIEIHSTQASPAFFEQRSAELLVKLTAAEQSLDRFRNERQIASIEIQEEALISQISGLETNLHEVHGQIDASRARIAALQNSLNSRSETRELSRVTGITNHASDEIKKRLIELRFQEADLAQRYADDERALVDVRGQIEVALAELAKEEETHTEVTTGIDRNLEALQLELMTERAQLYASMARLQSLRQELQTKRAALAQLADDEIELLRLGRTVDIADQEYREYIAHHQRADISAALDSDKVSNVSIVQPASYSSKPVAPRRFLNLVLSLFIGLFGGVGIAFLAELLDDSIKTRQDVDDRLGLPVLIALSAEEYQSCM